MLQLTSKRIRASAVQRTLQSDGLALGTATAVAATAYKIGSAIPSKKARIFANAGMVAAGTMFIAGAKHPYMRSLAGGLIVGGVTALLMPRSA